MLQSSTPCNYHENLPIKQISDAAIPSLSTFVLLNLSKGFNWLELTPLGSASFSWTKGKNVNRYYSDMWSFTQKLSCLKLRISTLVLSKLFKVSIPLIREKKSSQVWKGKKGSGPGELRQYYQMCTLWIMKSKSGPVRYEQYHTALHSIHKWSIQELWKAKSCPN